MESLYFCKKVKFSDTIGVVDIETGEILFDKNLIHFGSYGEAFVQFLRRDGKIFVHKVLKLTTKQNNNKKS